MSPGRILLAAHGLSKTYLLWDSPMSRLISILLEGASKRVSLPKLSRYLLQNAKAKARHIQALKPLDFELKQGESLGVIGCNGSGKSTLLQLLAGTLTPTTGQVSRNGRITALLELGSGFNPEFTGRENVLMQSALYGFDDGKALELLPKVEAFAEIGEFIDQPVKTYSSGMMVRLAFAAQTVVDPDICIVDEALSVGDVFFQAIREKIARGMSLILVTHDLPSVKALCSKALVLDSGTLVYSGPSDAAVSAYHELDQSKRAKAKKVTSQTSVSKGSSWLERDWESQDEIGEKEAEIVGFRILDIDGRATQSFLVGEPVRFQVKVKANEDIPEANLAFQVVDRHSKAIYGLNSRLQADLTKGLSREQSGIFEVDMEGLLGFGDFMIDVAIVAGDRGDGAPALHYHRIGGIAHFSVRHPNLQPEFLGAANLKAKVKWRADADQSGPAS